MTDTLVIDPEGLNLVVPCQRAGKAEKRTVGGVSIAFAGNERSHIRAELDVIPVVFINTLPSTCRIIEQIFAKRNQVDCAGTVFNRDDDGETIVRCSGTYTDEMEQGGTWRVPGLTLYEVENADTGVFNPDTTTITLSGGISDDDPGDDTVYEATPGTPTSNPGVCFRCLDAATPATCSLPGPCAVTYSAVPERIWLTVPLAAGSASGVPTVVVHSKGINGLSGIDLQSTMAKLYHVRSGSDIAGPVESDYENGDWAGGNISFPFTTSIAWTLLAGDQIRLELWSRLSLLPGATDPQPYVLARQTICYGGFYGAYLQLGGSIEAL